jgi:hypothetical protein
MIELWWRYIIPREISTAICSRLFASPIGRNRLSDKRMKKECMREREREREREKYLVTRGGVEG